MKLLLPLNEMTFQEFPFALFLNNVDVSKRIPLGYANSIVLFVAGGVGSSYILLVFSGGLACLRGVNF